MDDTFSKHWYILNYTQKQSLLFYCFAIRCFQKNIQKTSLLTPSPLEYQIIFSSNKSILCVRGFETKIGPEIEEKQLQGQRYTENP